MKKLLSIAFVSLLMTSSIVAFAQTPTRGNVAILLDLSGSMNAELEGKSRRDVAVEALTSTVGEIDGSASVALYAFGNNFDNSPSSKAESCEDINKLVNYGKDNAAAIKEVLVGVEAKGWTPLAKSIERIGNDLSNFGDSEHHVIILSDGEESCNGDPIAAVEALKANGVNVIVNTIGLDVDANTKAQLEGIAAAGGGEYFDAADSSQLAVSLEKAVTSEPFEEQGEADFGSELALPEGGSDFGDAVELDIEYFDGRTLELPKHIQAGTYHTYKLPIDDLNVGDEILFGQILHSSLTFNEDGTASITTEGSFLEFEITLFNKRKSELRNFNIWGETNKFEEETYVLTEIDLDEVLYMFIGNADKNTSKNNKVYFELTQSKEESAQAEEAVEDLETEETVKSEDLAIEQGELNLEALLDGLDSESDIVGALEANKAELMKSDEGKAMLEAAGIETDESFLNKKAFGVKNIYLVGGLIGILVLLTLSLVLLSRKKKA